MRESERSVIHIFGASGSGMTTLARYICQNLAYTPLDSDDYFWLPTDPPFTEKREAAERVRLMRADILRAEKAVVSGSLAGWGDALIPCFTLCIRLVTETGVRIERLRRRERERFGARIEPGGI
jgi:adenylate kinase family enzyme